MTSFGPAELLLPTAAIFLATLFASLRFTRNAVTALELALLKAGLYALYFGVLFDGTYTFLDDWSYLEGGAELLREGVGVFSLPEHWELVLTVGRGDHFAYYLYNTYAFRLFGEGYYAPVACNVLVTLVIAAVGARLAATELELNRRQTRWLYVFLLLHPDILAWSTVPNGKDPLTLAMHVLLLLAASLFIRGRRRQAITLAAPVCVLLVFVRFYVPFMFVLALSLGAVLARRERGDLGRFLVVGLLLLAAAAGISSQFDYALDVLNDTLVNPVFGLVRVLLTPVPFHTDEAFAFLNLPALFHWMMLPFLFSGGLAVWRLRTRFSAFFVAYLLAFLALYAVVGELQGPRHRVQLDYAIALLQFVGVLQATGWLRLRMRSRLEKPRRPDGARLA